MIFWRRAGAALGMFSLIGVGACAPSLLDATGGQWLALAPIEERLYACGYGDELTRVALTAMRERAQRAVRLDATQHRALGIKVEQAVREAASAPCAAPDTALLQTLTAARAEAVALVSALFELHRRPSHHYPKARADALLANGGQARLEAWLSEQQEEATESLVAAWVGHEREQLARNRSAEFFAGRRDPADGQSWAVAVAEAVLDELDWRSQAQAQAQRRGGRGIQPWTAVRSEHASGPMAIGLFGLSFYGRTYPARLALLADHRLQLLIERDDADHADAVYPAVLSASIHVAAPSDGERDPFLVNLSPEPLPVGADARAFDGVAINPATALAALGLRQPEALSVDTNGWSWREPVRPERLLAAYEFPPAAGLAVRSQGPTGSVTIAIKVDGFDGEYRSATGTLGLVDALTWAEQ